MHAILRFAVACIALAITQAASATDLATYDGPYMQRPNLLVADIPTALKVYRDVLGFRTSAVIPSSPGAVTYDIYKLPPEAILRFTFLSADRERIIALTEVKGATLPKPQQFTSSLIIEMQHDLDGKIAALKALGLEVGDVIALTDPSGAKRRDVSVTDVDGHRIVLYELDKK